MVQLSNSAGTITKTYDYDAFGVEKNPDPNDTNLFRYCGEYLDFETNTYYLRARYYDPGIGRFTSEDTHWNPGNRVYGDNPVKIRDYKDPLGLNAYTYIPSIAAIRQSGNLYAYGMSNPVMYVDPTGESALVGAKTGAAVGTVIGGPVVGTAVGAVIGAAAGLVFGWFIGTAVANEVSKAGGITYAKDNAPAAPKKKPAPPSKLKDGDKVKTPESHPEEFTKNKDGSYTHKKTGWTASRDKSGHGGPHWDMAPGKGSGHINVGPDGNIFGGSMK